MRSFYASLAHRRSALPLRRIGFANERSMQRPRSFAARKVARLWHQRSDRCNAVSTCCARSGVTWSARSQVGATPRSRAEMHPARDERAVLAGPLAHAVVLRVEHAVQEGQRELLRRALDAWIQQHAAGTTAVGEDA